MLHYYVFSQLIRSILATDHYTRGKCYFDPWHEECVIHTSNVVEKRKEKKEERLMRNILNK